VLAPLAHAQSAPLDGPPGRSLNKVLVIGIDGTRWDLLRGAMRAGRAPNLARLQRSGFGRPSQLPYKPPEALTLSEVGWSSIAAGVWPDKHGVDGRKFNADPGQATKNGYLDFLTRIEQSRPRLSTFLASDWANIGLRQNGGPIFGSAMDARFALDTEVETLEAWDGGDQQVTAAAERYLRRGDPDAGFVYLGLVDETAHLVGSALPAYPASITTTDRRIGRLLRAVRARPSFAFESWTILVSTDHGQRPYEFPTPASHIGGTALEQTVFVIGSGPGLGPRVARPRIVDLAPTVIHQLGLRVDPRWRLDGRPLTGVRPPSSATAAVRARRLAARVVLGTPRRARWVRLRLPAGVRLAGGAALTVKVNGRAARGVRAAGRTITVRPGGKPLRRLLVRSARAGVRIDPGVRRAGPAKLSVTLRALGRGRSTLQISLAGPGLG